MTYPNNIALIRVNREIQFGTKMKPICLPFGSNRTPQPRVNSNYTITGWDLILDTETNRIKHGKVYANFTLCDNDKKIVINKSMICVVGDADNLRYGNYGSPLMNQFDGQRMILEGLYSIPTPEVSSYTQVSSYHNWLDENMKM